MTALLSAASLAAVVLRIGARLVIAVSDEIDSIVETYRVEIPDYMPEAWGVRS